MLTPSDIGRAIGKRIILQVVVGDSVSVSVVSMVMLLMVKVGPEQKHPGMSLRMVLTMQASIFATSTDVFSACKKPGSLLLWPRRNSCSMPVLASVNVQHWAEREGRGVCSE